MHRSSTRSRVITFCSLQTTTSFMWSPGMHSRCVCCMYSTKRVALVVFCLKQNRSILRFKSLVYTLHRSQPHKLTNCCYRETIRCLWRAVRAMAQPHWKNVDLLHICFLSGETRPVGFFQSQFDSRKKKQLKKEANGFRWEYFPSSWLVGRQEKRTWRFGWG